MRLLVLAAGMGTRLKPYTDNLNKSMIPIAGRPLLYHSLMQCIRINPPLTEIVMVVGYRREQIEQYFCSEFQGVPIRYIYQETLDGIAGAVALAAPLLADEPFLMILGDELLLEPNLPQMADYFLSAHVDGLCGVLREKPLEEICKNYTLRLSADGSIDKVVEKPERPFNNLLGLGYCIFSASTLPFAAETPTCPIRKQRGMCEWITLCIEHGLRFYPYTAGKDAVNLNSRKELNWLREALSQGDLQE